MSVLFPVCFRITVAPLESVSTRVPYFLFFFSLMIFPFSGLCVIRLCRVSLSSVFSTFRSHAFRISFFTSSAVGHLMSSRSSPCRDMAMSFVLTSHFSMLSAFSGVMLLLKDLYRLHSSSMHGAGVLLMKFRCSCLLQWLFVVRCFVLSVCMADLSIAATILLVSSCPKPYVTARFSSATRAFNAFRHSPALKFADSEKARFVADME